MSSCDDFEIFYNDFGIESSFLIGYSGNDKNVEIPCECGVLLGMAFSNNDNIETVTLGENVYSMNPTFFDKYYDGDDPYDDEALCESSLYDYIYDDDSFKYVFANCKNLKKIKVLNQGLLINKNLVDNVKVLKNSVDTFFAYQATLDVKKIVAPTVAKIILSVSDNDLEINKTDFCYCDEYEWAEEGDDVDEITKQTWKESWLSFFKLNTCFLYNVIAESDDLLKLYMKEGFLNLDDINELIPILKESSKMDSVDLLLDYQHKNFPKQLDFDFFEEENGSTINVDQMISNDWNIAEQEDGSIIIKEYKGKKTKIEVPKLINEKAVTAIGSYAFSPAQEDISDTQKVVRKAIESIVVPESVISIGEKAFYGCKKLNNLELPKNKIDCGESIVAGCSSLKYFRVPEGVKELTSEEFAGCENLETIEIPSSVTEIHKNTFKNLSKYNSRNPRNIIIDKKNPKFYALDNVLYTRDRSRFLYIPHNISNLNLPIGMTKITESMLWDDFGIDPNNLNSIAIPESMRKIDLHTYKSECLSEFTLAETIDDEDTISCFKRLQNDCFYVYGRRGTYAQYFCEEQLYGDFAGFSDSEVKERKANVKEWRREISKSEGSYYFIEQEDGTLEITSYDSDDTEELIIPDTIAGKKVTMIGYNAFYGCDNLKSVTIPDSVVKIDMYAFDSCINLKSVNIPSTVTAIGSGAFYSCSNLESVKIPEGVTELRFGTFYNCENLKEVFIPETVTEIKDYSFDYCKKLTIFGKADSYAQEYAECNNFNFKTF